MLFPLTKYRPPRKFPAAKFDLSVIAAARELVGTIGNTITASGVPGIIAVEYVDQYFGPPLVDGTKSATFRITVGADDRTLSGDEISLARASVIVALVDAGYALRG